MGGGGGGGGDPKLHKEVSELYKGMLELYKGEPELYKGGNCQEPELYRWNCAKAKLGNIFEYLEQDILVARSLLDLMQVIRRPKITGPS